MLTFVHLDHVDGAGHTYGHGTSQYYAAVGRADKLVGEIVDAVKRAGTYNETIFIITSDHGGIGKGHGGQSDRERLTWIVTNAKGLNPYFYNNEPGIVDIMPTILRSFDIHPLKEQLWELDGAPLTGPISIANAKSTLEDNKVQISWEAFEKKGNLKIWVSLSNNFSKGGKDEYVLLKKVKTKSQKVDIDLSDYPSGFYKIILEGKHNTLNTWVIKE